MQNHDFEPDAATMRRAPGLPTSSELLKGRRILVTGAAGAIGAAICTALESHGATVTRSDKGAADGSQQLDVTDEDSVRQSFAGIGPVTDIVHCAGSLILGPIAETSLADFRAAADINLLGAFLVGREAARTLPPGGSLTMIASQAGFRAGANWGVYCALKAGVMRLCEALAQELGSRNVRVNCVCPGSVATPMLDEVCERLSRLKGEPPEAVRARYEAAVPLRRYAEPREIGNICVFLASPLASYLSGASIPVDGGEISA